MARNAIGATFGSFLGLIIAALFGSRNIPLDPIGAAITLGVVGWGIAAITEKNR